jgi:hypothetical protein
MNFEEALCAELQAISGLQQKVFPQNAEEGTEPPFAVYMSSEGEKIQTLDGYSDLTELSFETTVVATNYEAMKSLTKAVLDRIKSFFGRSIGTNGPVIKSVSHIEPVEEFQQDQNYHKSTINVRVRF